MSAATPVPVLREAVRAEAEATSLRAVARATGMSPAGVLRFVNGAHPLAATVRRLERWYVLQGPGKRPREALDGDTALAVLRVLVQDVPLPRQTPLLEALARSLVDAYALAHLPEPEWLTRVRDSVRAEPG